MKDNTYLMNKISQEYRFYSDTEKKVADYFRQNSNELIKKTITHLSDEIGVSQTTIFKFVKKLGFDGFQDFKISLAVHSKSSDSDSVLTAYTDITPQDTSDEVATKVLNSNIKSMNYLINSMSKEKLDNVLTMIQKCNYIHFFGIGGSSVIAYDSYQKFLRTKYRCDFTFDYHLQLMNATKLKEDDVVFLFSHSGQSVETLNFAQEVSKSQAKLIVLTGNPYSDLVRLSDESFTIYSEESKFRTESLSSRILYLTVMDIIYVNLMYQDDKVAQTSMSKIRSILSTSKTESDYIL
ncbi:hypothetical protein DOK78_002936 [Enterococcus sp. DIV2402]|uniref:MurR/RpiR family transcriptional regulator n=1 Tax=Candidatus Enterococcus lowellii TaxID=2230877 RepID=A0ABZ2SW37_9ENTE|nr:MurR/RpiR family transcriptional regulator [Enterococcus sp. DIV2402]MBO0465401.1 MurR/RpiR family transcriptional regulator [Enterococcus sp. DIV2402]